VSANSRTIAILQGTGVVLAGCVAGVLAKRSLRDVEAFTFVWLQIAIGGALLTLYTFGLRRERIPRGLGLEVWGYIVAIGIGNFTIVRVMSMLSLELLPMNTHIYLTNFVGVATMLTSVLVLRERPSVIQVVGALVAIGGLWVFFDRIPQPSEMTGVVYVSIGVVALALTNNLARKLAIVTENKLSNNVVSTVAVWIGGTPVLIHGLATDCPPAVPGFEHWCVIVLNGVVAITIGLTVWNYILRTLRSYEASILATSSVIFVALLAIPILGERLAPRQMAGIGLMIIGMVMSQFRRAFRRAPGGG
jgi:drug/metabolite transporter (DMT)-like permease